jgi:hypothetical protein
LRSPIVTSLRRPSSTTMRDAEIGPICSDE